MAQTFAVVAQAAQLIANTVETPVSITEGVKTYKDNSPSRKLDTGRGYLYNGMHILMEHRDVLSPESLRIYCKGHSR